MCGRFVEDEHPWIGEQRAGQQQPLTLAAGHPLAVRPDPGHQAVRQGRDPVGEPHPGEHAGELRVSRPGTRDQQVLPHRRVEHVRILCHPGDTSIQLVGSDVPQVHPTDLDPARHRVTEAQQQVDDAALAHAAGPDERDPAAGR